MAKMATLPATICNIYINVPFALVLLFLPCFERQGCELPEVIYAFADAPLLIPGSPESASVAPD